VPRPASQTGWFEVLAIVRGIVALAKALNLSLTGEGVEPPLIMRSSESLAWEACAGISSPGPWLRISSAFLRRDSRDLLGNHLMTCRATTR